jgi:hypothetical protein
MTVDLMSGLVIATVNFRADYGQETSGQAGGQIRVKDLRSPLWMMDADCSTLSMGQLRRVRALIGSLGGSRGTFEAWDPAAQYPEADPKGAIVGASAVLINTLGSDGISLSLKALPAGYVLSAGDMLAFDYSTSPTRRALHQVVAGATANGSGITPEFEVHPPIRQGAAANNPVNLKRPAAVMRLVPGSFPQQVARNLGSLSLKAIQVI